MANRGYRFWDAKLNCYAPDDDFWITYKGKWATSLCSKYASYKGDDIIPEQSTGLCDKKGREIYEGDICRIVRYNGELQTAGDIFFDKGAFRITNGYAVADTDSLGRFKADIVEVVGNIHENNELLK